MINRFPLPARIIVVACVPRQPTLGLSCKPETCKDRVIGVGVGKKFRLGSSAVC